MNSLFTAIKEGI